MVSISPVPKTPRPVSNPQFAVLTLPFAGPSKLSAQTCFHDEGWLGESDADEQPVPTRTMSMLSQAAGRHNRRETLERSLVPPAFRLATLSRPTVAEAERI